MSATAGTPPPSFSTDTRHRSPAESTLDKNDASPDDNIEPPNRDTCPNAPQTKPVDHDLSELRRELDESRLSQQRLKSELQDREDRTKAAELEREEALEDLEEETNARIAQLESEKQDLLVRALKSEDAFDASQHKVKKLEALLESRTTELRAAEAFLNQADDVADSDVVGLVTTLNAHAYHIAAAIADSFRTRCGVGKERVAQACADLTRTGLLPKELAEALRTGSQDDLSVLVQVAMQSVITAHACELCSAWDQSTNSLMQRSCNRIYESIKAREPQAVAGRWRALCHTHLRLLLESESELHSELENKLARRLVTVLQAGGVPGIVDDLCAELRLTPGCDLHDVVQTALEFRRVVGETVISREFAVVAISPGKDYDDERMQDEWSDPRLKGKQGQEGAQTVLCTTSLGLSREAEDDGRGSERAKSRVVQLEKPKVALVAMLSEL